MAGLPYYRTIDGLPSTIPVFPLPGALLLPRGTLPLNIFEPRYVSMVEDALKSDGRVIGMIQPDEEADDVGSAHCFAIGCAGRIIQFTETDDGRYLITLIGLARYRVARELALAAGAYRLVEADYTDFADDMRPVSATDMIERTALIAHLKQFFHKKQIEADWDAIGKANDETLVTALSMVCPFSPLEKQALLEAGDFLERASILTTLLEIGSREDDDSPVRQ